MEDIIEDASQEKRFDPKNAQPEGPEGSQAEFPGGLATLLPEALEGARVGIAILDSDLDLQWANLSFERYFGLARDTVLGMNLRQLFLDHLGPALEHTDELEKRLWGGPEPPLPGEPCEVHLLPQGDRPERWLAYQGRPIGSGPLHGGRIEYYYDITERKTLEELLQRSPTRYQTIIEQAPISIIAYSPEGRPVMANHASRELWQITREGWEYLQENYNILEDPQIKALGLGPFLKKGFEGEVSRFPAIPYDLRQIPDSQAVSTSKDKLWTKATIYPVKDRDGKVTEVVLIQEDITSQQQAEEKLRKSEQRFRELAENIREVFWLFDWIEQRVLYASPAFETVWGKTVQDLYASYEIWGESIHPDDITYAQESFLRIAQTGGGEVREYRIIRPDGSVRWISDRGFAITNSDAEVVRIAGIAEDITAQKQALAQINRRLAFEETIADISTRFVGQADLDESIDIALEKMGRLSQASRVYLFLFRPDGASMDNRYEWCAEGIEPEKDNLQNLSFADFPWVMPRLLAGETVAIEDVTAMPPEAGSLQESLVQQGILGCLLMPVWIADEVAGFLGFDNTLAARPWEQEDMLLLRISAETLGNALTRKKFEDSERAARRMAEVLREAMAALSSELNLDQVLNRILVYLDKVLPSDSASVLLIEGDELTVMAGRGLPAMERILGQRFPADNELVQAINDTGQPIILSDAKTDARFQKWGGLGYVRGWMGIPLKERGEIIGYLTVDSKQAGAYGEEDLELARIFAHQASIALENARLFERVQKLATTDPLTGLFNRRYFFELADWEIKRARRYHRPLSALMLDIDRFKRVNDSHGHAVGDQVLAGAAELICHEVRDTDIIGRYGGEEFVVLLPELELPRAAEVAERIREGISRARFDSGNGPVSITVSIGVAALAEGGIAIDELLDLADQALYGAKARGRNCVHVIGAA